MPDFISPLQTGNENYQRIPHSLGGVPAAVMIVPTKVPPGIQGYELHDHAAAHTDQYIEVHVTSGVVYRVYAWAQPEPE